MNHIRMKNMDIMCARIRFIGIIGNAIHEAKVRSITKNY